MKKILLISLDNQIKRITNSLISNSKYQFIFYSSTNDPLEVMAHVCSINPSILFLDDDFLSPNTTKILASIKKVNPKLSIIFLTSNTSMELGREIHSIGVKFYLIKPISEKDFREYLNSANKQLVNNKY